MFRSTTIALLAAYAAAAGTGLGNGAANCKDQVLVDNAQGTLTLCYYYSEAGTDGEFHGDLNYVSKTPMMQKV